MSLHAMQTEVDQVCALVIVVSEVRIVRIVGEEVAEIHEPLIPDYNCEVLVNKCNPLRTSHFCVANLGAQDLRPISDFSTD